MSAVVSSVFADTSPCASTVDVAEADSAISLRRLVREPSIASLHRKAHCRKSSYRGSA